MIPPLVVFSVNINTIILPIEFMVAVLAALAAKVNVPLVLLGMFYSKENVLAVVMISKLVKSLILPLRKIRLFNKF